MKSILLCLLIISIAGLLLVIFWKHSKESYRQRKHLALNTQPEIGCKTCMDVEENYADTFPIYKQNSFDADMGNCGCNSYDESARRCGCNSYAESARGCGCNSYACRDRLSSDLSNECRGYSSRYPVDLPAPDEPNCPGCNLVSKYIIQ